MAVSGGVQAKYPFGNPISYTVSAAVTAGKLVAATASGTVATAPSDSRNVVGVAMQTASAAGDVIPVSPGGTWKLKAKGAITAGDQLMASTDGLGDVSTIVTTNVTTMSGLIGVALEDIADGASGLVRIRPL